MTNVLEELKKDSAALDARLAADVEASEKGTLKADDAAATRKAVEEYVVRAKEIIETAKTAKDSKKQLAEIAAALTEAGAKPEEGQGTPKFADLSHYSGIVNPQGMSLGQALVSSDAYKDLEGLRSMDGGLTRGARPDIRWGIKGGLRDQFEADSETGELVSKTLSSITDAARGRVELPVDPYHPESATGLRLRDVMNFQTATEGNTFEYVTMTHTNNAAFTAEATSDAPIGAGAGEVTAVVGGLKPGSDVQYTAQTDVFRTLPHLVTLHRNHLADRGRMMGEVNTFLRDSLWIVENQQIIAGTGAPGLDGMLPNTDIPTHTAVGSPTDLDLVLQAVAAIWAQGRRPNAMIISPSDWFTDGFVLAKDGNQNYLFGGPTSGYEALTGVWGLRVFVDTSMTAGQAIIGDFSGATFVDRQAATVHITDSHEDYFARNLIAVLIEERVGFAVTDPLRFIKIGGLDA